MPSCHWKRNDTQRGSEGSLPSQIMLSISENICFTYNRFQRIILGIVCYRPIGLKFTKDEDLHVHMSARQGNVSPNLGFTAESPAIVSIHICCMEPTEKSGKCFNLEDFSLSAVKIILFKVKARKHVYICWLLKVLGPLNLSWQHRKPATETDLGRRRPWWASHFENQAEVLESWSFLHT